MPRGRNWVMGEQLAQVDNRDPFAAPVWRSPVYRTPEAVILVVQLVRLVWRGFWFSLTPPALGAWVRLVVVTWLPPPWPGVIVLRAGPPVRHLPPPVRPPHTFPPVLA